VNTSIAWIGLCSVLRPLQHSIGYMGDGFYSSALQSRNIPFTDKMVVQAQC